MDGKLKISMGIRGKLLTSLLPLIILALLLQAFFHFESDQNILEAELTKRIDTLKKSLEKHGQHLSERISLHIEEQLATFNLKDIEVFITQELDDDIGLHYAIITDVSRNAYLHNLIPELRGTILSKPADIFASKQETPHTCEKLSFLGRIT